LRTRTPRQVFLDDRTAQRFVDRALGRPGFSRATHEWRW
jgi:hypothetical protein